MKVELNRQLIGLEDIIFGEGTVIQTRGGASVEVTKINAANLPFNEIQSLKEVLDNMNLAAISNSIPAIDRVHESIGNVDAVGAELLATDNIELLGSDLALGANSEIRKAIILEPKMDYTKNTLESKMDYTKNTLESKMDYTKNTLESKMDYTKNTLEAKMDYVDNTLEAKMDYVIANGEDLQNVTINAELARDYATQAEDVEVEPGLYSAKHWALKASEAAATELESKVDKNIVNTDTVGVGILVGSARKEWTQGFAAFTGAILIELTGLYDEASMVGRMTITINSTVGNDRIFDIDGRWLSTMHIWDEANVLERTTASDRLNVRFARDTVNGKVYLVIGETTSNWNALRISIDDVLTNYNNTLNLGFAITSTTNISGLTIDYIKVDTNIGTVAEFNAAINF